MLVSERDLLVVSGHPYVEHESRSLVWSIFSHYTQKCTSDIIDVVALIYTKTTNIPLELHLKLLLTDGTPLADPTRYRHLVGKLVYLYLTRLDISHAISTVSQFVSTPHYAHYSALLRIL